MRILILLLVILSLPEFVQATLYTYVDNHGVRHYTNVPGDPRAKAVILAEHKVTTIAGLRARISSANSKKQPRQCLTAHHRANSSRLESHIRRACMQHQVDPLLIKAIIKTESNFDQFAVSAKGAQGLMQLMPETAKDLQVSDPFDAYQNISAGTRYFRNLLDTFSGNIRLSLAAYNAGPGRVARFGAIPRIPETIDYVRTVLRHYREYKQTKRLSTSINLRRLVTIN